MIPTNKKNIVLFTKWDIEKCNNRIIQNDRYFNEVTSAQFSSWIVINFHNCNVMSNAPTGKKLTMQKLVMN